MPRATAGQPSIRRSSRRVTAFAATVGRSPPWSAQRGARLIGSPSTARRNWRMRSRHSTRTCYQISLRLRFDATETRACGRERRRCHVKGLIAWPKASSLVGLFPECIVTRTVSIKVCARHCRRGEAQLKLLMQMASTLPVDLKNDFLRVCADQLKVKTNDVKDAGERALAYL